MPYTVEITTPPVQIDGAEQASRMYQLPDPFSTLAEAKEAAITQPSCITYAVPARHLEALLRAAR